MLQKLFIKTPLWARALFPHYVWRFPSTEKVVYLTFDDGPHPTITPWVLDLLQQYDAKATFFCIGENVVQFPDTYQQILDNGHSIGNHTYHHFNGWKTPADLYLEDVARAAAVIQSNLFRPPYGKITKRQAKGLAKAGIPNCRVIMWDVLSADYDTSYSAQRCMNNVLKNVEPGSIVVFHDSGKAFPNLKSTLPLILKYFKNEGYKFEKILMEVP
jgi:peptidoglycan-N-acetylglucosamine deacetylase